MSSTKVSILMLTYNAPEYVELAIRSVRDRTQGVAYELIVLDNASDDATVELLKSLDDEKLIDRLVLLDHNSLFAEGNNRAARLAASDSTHYCLLNSDVEIRDPDWLLNLTKVHRRGITAYGIAEDPLRVDGYCLLIDSDIYDSHQLDEGHQWYWAVTKLQASVLNAGLEVQGFSEHEQYVHHFGGKSGSGFIGAKGLVVSRSEVGTWFNGRRPTILDWDAWDRGTYAARRIRRGTRRMLQRAH